MQDIVRFLDPGDNFKIDLADIYMIADPFNHNSVTFSMFVLAAASTRVVFNMEEVSLVQFTNLFEKE